MTASAFAFLHGAYMFTHNSTLGIKEIKGSAAAITILAMLILGLRILAAPKHLPTRIWHRRLMYYTVVLIIAHIIS